jgi:hypothetical protein
LFADTIGQLVNQTSFQFSGTVVDTLSACMAGSFTNVTGFECPPWHRFTASNWVKWQAIPMDAAQILRALKRCKRSGDLVQALAEAATAR